MTAINFQYGVALPLVGIGLPAHDNECKRLLTTVIINTRHGRLQRPTPFEALTGTSESWLAADISQPTIEKLLRGEAVKRKAHEYVLTAIGPYKTGGDNGIALSGCVKQSAAVTRDSGLTA
jgi:hypothetical protein